MATRYVTGDSYLFPASHCDTCQTPLAYWQLVPVLSYALLRGKCQICGDSSSYHHHRSRCWPISHHRDRLGQPSNGPVARTLGIRRPV
ncbi:prepilin peptidase [Levilactobacillus parabrevis]|uniref:prepilin peptidase n=1 Tax=Levilactobacillus parabrevis TaxID=357278 RepID=UPI0021A6D741|nr:prepilin peptidase [Levilactobacillus parabrevis]